MGNVVAQMYAKLGLDTAQFQKGLTDAKTGLQKFSSTFKEVTGVSLGFASGAAAAAGAINQIRKAVNETVQYATSVKDMSRLLGISAEDTSRLIQATDDLFISEDKLNTALLAASRQGLDVSINGLKDLSTQYLALAPGAERAQFLMQKFGRSGADMGKLMEVGADGIDKATSAIASNLVMTDDSIAKVEEYKRNLDNLNDAWQGVKYTVGEDVIPSLSALLKLVGDLSGGTKSLGVSIDQFVNKVFGGWGFESAAHKAADAVRDYEDANNLATMSTVDVINSMSWVSDAAKAEALKIAQLADETKKAADDQTKANQGFLSQVSSWANVEKDYAASIEEVTAQQDKHTRTLEYWSGVVARAPSMVEELTKKVELLSQEGGENSDAYRDAKKELEKWQTTLDGGAGALAGMNKQLDDDKQKIKDLAAEHELATHKIVLGYLEQQLAQDGLSKEETDFLLQKGVEWGVYSDTVIQEMRDAWAEVDQLTNHINGIPKTITISTILQESLPGYTKPKRATETAHANGGSWMIPMGYGYEGYRMPGGQTASGGEVITVTPKGKEASNQIILTDEQLKKIGEASGNATAVKLMQLGVLR